MERIAIDVAGSRAIAFAEYDPEDELLRIRYVDGETYDYLRVPPSIVEELVAAESKGKFVNKVIKPRFTPSKLARRA